MNYKNLLDYYSYDEGNFVVMANIEFGVPFEKATCDWRNAHRVGKYVICESKPEEKRKYKRLYIRLVTDTMSDGLKKHGWWNTFTLCETEVPVGLWLCVTKEFRLDKNGYINMIVDAVCPVPNMKYRFIFEPENGTWNSPAVKLMLGSGKFMPEYNFQTFNNLNIEEFIVRYPQYSTLNRKELGDAVLKDWLQEKISLEEIEDALNEKTPYEKLLRTIQVGIANGNLISQFPQYPNLCEKISLRENSEGFLPNTIGFYEVKNYIERNIFSYNDLVAEGKIEKIAEENPLDMVETVLAYRRNQKELAKQAKKAKRKG